MNGFSDTETNPDTGRERLSARSNEGGETRGRKAEPTGVEWEGVETQMDLLLECCLEFLLFVFRLFGDAIEVW